ncbi:hypothetical protein ACJMK2_008080 [Sinanodonta woodiana]|uniref:DH domain-containing protein n=1 Tax=Sinanodonta woodiana TaxID=1069815 RepID=A0ABD3VKG7_SINWO
MEEDIYDDAFSILALDRSKSVTQPKNSSLCSEDSLSPSHVSSIPAKDLARENSFEIVDRSGFVYNLPSPVDNSSSVRGSGQYAFEKSDNFTKYSPTPFKVAEDTSFPGMYPNYTPPLLNVKSGQMNKTAFIGGKSECPDEDDEYKAAYPQLTVCSPGQQWTTTGSAVSEEFKIKSKRKSRTLARGQKPFLEEPIFNNAEDGAVFDVAPDKNELFDTVLPFMSSDDDSFISFSSDGSDEFGLSSDDNSPPNKPLPPPPVRNKGKGKHSKPTPWTGSNQEENSVVLPVNVNQTKHPPPMLPPVPKNLNSSQEKMRHIMQSLIETEQSYVMSLEKLTFNYQNVIVGHGICRQDFVKRAFQKVTEIYNYHKMCQIELSDTMKNWHTRESIGNFFIAFSKKVIVDAYSAYVNCYSITMEVLKTVMRTKPSIWDDLKGVDKMPIEGLMLKPVQRFPQYIMIVKDLLKYTPRDHMDRERLQEALTELENVAHQLNERKRMSEQIFHGQRIMNKLGLKAIGDAQVYLLRQDDVQQLAVASGGGSSHPPKQRRLFLMNDSLISDGCRGPTCLILLNQYLICSSSGKRDRDGCVIDQYTYKWCVGLQHLELKDSAIAPSKHSIIEGNIGNTCITSSRIENPEEDPYNIEADLYDMILDYNVLAQIAALIQSLKKSYQAISEDKVQETLCDLQKMIQSKDFQLQTISSHSIVLFDSYRNKTYVFQTSSPEVKLEWCVDFLLAKYALDPINQPSWDKQQADDTDEFSQNIMPAYLIKHMSVDVPRHFTRIKCTVPVFLPTSGNEDMGLQHLWVCSSKEDLGQVSIISIHSAKPNLLESFQVTKCEIVCAEMVPGFALVQSERAFAEDTVWMSTVDAEIVVFTVVSTNKSHGRFSQRTAAYVFQMKALVLMMQYVDERLFAGMRAGGLTIFSRSDEGIWNQFQVISLGQSPVVAMTNVGTETWVICDSRIHVFEADSNERKTVLSLQQDAGSAESDEVIRFIVKVGVGLWVSYQGKPLIRLFHLESRKHLQDVNITTSASKLFTEYSGTTFTASLAQRHFEVTSLETSLGLLWVGTNVGIILAYPLPRLQDGVPRINVRPSVALHGHQGTVKFIIPVSFGAVATRGSMEEDEQCTVGVSNVASVGAHGASKESRHVQTQNQIRQKEGTDAENRNEKSHYSVPVTKLKISEDLETSAQSRRPNQIQNLKHENQAEKNDLEDSSRFSAESHIYFTLLPESTTLQTADAGLISEQTVGNYNSQLTIESPLTDVSGQAGEAASGAKARISDLAKSGDFRLELEHKLARRRALDLRNSPLVCSGEDEVEVLYGNLLESGSTASTQSHMGQKSSILPTGPAVEHDRTMDEREGKKDNSTSSVYRKAPFNLPQMTQAAPGDKLQRHASWRLSQGDNKNSRTNVGTSFRSGSTLDTLRKQNTTAFMVLSGGDGYIDWKGRNPSQYRPDEACLLVWLYKF